mmetsp:Transcript_652/g.951  ORF Transcript_652/g.951 Transcript_652/m.951 type:complete len:635 (-) Transcript_652:124-2028(-)
MMHAVRRPGLLVAAARWGGETGTKRFGTMAKQRMARTLSGAQQEIEYVAYNEAGHRLLENPIYNKGSAFTESERDELGLRGLLPPHVECIEEQLHRAYQSYKHKPTDMERHIYLRQLQDTNEVMFYALVQRHIREFLPILYTPTVGHACIRFSQIWRRPRGVFLSYPQRHKMRDIFEDLMARGWTGAPTDIDTRLDVRTIVVTDGGRILGLGDLGAGGMGIPIGKCSLYTGIGGIPGWETLPVFLDVGTNNEAALADPSYIGWRHERLTGDEYFEFVDMFVENVKRYMPHALLQWEDFNIDSAQPLLERYKDELCTFNDDIQGTASVTVGTLLAACERIGRRISEQKVVVVGSGSAGCGIASMIKKAMIDDGLAEEEADERFYMIDRPGLLHDGMEDLLPFQKPLVQRKAALLGWEVDNEDHINLLEVIQNAKPDIMIGVSGVPGLFTEAVVREMTAGCSPRRPIIFPLSNPTERVEGCPSEVMRWSDNTAIVATGTAFPHTKVETKVSTYESMVTTHHHTQCNNSYIFPGIGLACKVVAATRVTDNMLMAASKALAGCSPKGELDPLLPELEDVIPASKVVATAVAMQAIKDGVARDYTEEDEEGMRSIVERSFWVPKYKNVRIADAMWSASN